MDESEYRNAYRGLNPVRCVYEKSVLTQNCWCRHCHKFNLAEREGVSCQNEAAQQHCDLLLRSLRSRAHFVLHLPEIVGNLLPHSKEIQVQKGGLVGLAKTQGLELESNPYSRIDDIYGLIEPLLEGEELQAPPWQDILPLLAAFELPQRRRRERKKTRTQAPKHPPSESSEDEL